MEMYLVYRFGAGVIRVHPAKGDLLRLGESAPRKPLSTQEL